MQYFLAITIGYIFGSISFGYIAGKITGRDIRKEGYQRIGASNVYETLGFVPAVVVFFADFLKGIAPIFILTKLGFLEPVASIAGISAIIGHNFPVFLGFKGEGRGVATSGGVLFYILPLETMCGVAVLTFLTIVLKNSALPTFIFICMMPVLTLIFPEPIWTFGISLSISALLLATRLLGGLSQIRGRAVDGKTVFRLILFDSLQ